MWSIHTSVNLQHTHTVHLYSKSLLWQCDMPLTQRSLGPHIFIIYHDNPDSAHTAWASVHALVHVKMYDWCSDNYALTLQLDFAMVALGFQKANAHAKEVRSSKSKAGGSQSILEAIIDDGMVKPDPFISLLWCLSTAWALTVSIMQIMFTCYLISRHRKPAFVTHDYEASLFVT